MHGDVEQSKNKYNLWVEKWKHKAPQHRDCLQMEISNLSIDLN